MKKADARGRNRTVAQDERPVKIVWGPMALRQFGGNACAADRFLPAGSGYEKRLLLGAFSVPGAVADQSVITGGYRVFFGDNELVHCQKIDILIGVFTN